MPRTLAEEILDTAWALGVRVFDTAARYGESAARLCSWMDSRGRRADCQVVTKVAPAAAPELAEAINGECRRFADTATLTILSHGAINGAQWQAFRDGVAGGRRFAGQSVYTEAEVREASTLPGIVRIQAPANIFDIRALRARGDSAVPLDLRSVYLQGVLLETPEAAEDRASGAGALAAAVQVVAAELGETPSSLLVASALTSMRSGDRVVIGVDEPQQLPPIARAGSLDPGVVAAFTREVRRRIPDDPRENVLDPRTWGAM